MSQKTVNTVRVNISGTVVMKCENLSTVSRQKKCRRKTSGSAADHDAVVHLCAHAQPRRKQWFGRLVTDIRCSFGQPCLKLVRTRLAALARSRCAGCIRIDRGAV